MSGLVADHVGVANMLVFTTAVCSALVFSMLSVSAVGSVASFSALYGLFSGACEKKMLHIQRV